MHSCDSLILLFNQCFAAAYNTRLLGGAAEPIYLPMGADCAYHRIIFRQDYFASALHEVAHWCVAGSQRRLRADYGYWYAEDGRTEQQQKVFEQVEVKPQALEWLFSVAAGAPFRVSADNLTLGLGPSTAFKQAIADQAQAYCQTGMGERPRRFIAALANFYGVKRPLERAHYQLCRL